MWVPAPAPPPAKPDIVLRYEIVFSDRVAGSVVLVRQQGDGSYDEDYQFTDRGRGPKLHVRTEVGEGSIPTRVEVSGTEYLHRPVHELSTRRRCSSAANGTATRSTAKGPAASTPL